MSDPVPIFQQALAAPSVPRVEGAIARASERTGIDFGYLLAQAKVESSLDVDAKAPTSSASGLFQFIETTWLDVMRRHGAKLGYGQFAGAIEAGSNGPRVSNPLMRGQILALRNNPEAASMMAGALAQDNRDALMPVLGREPDAGELYLAHFLGSGGASRFLTALQARPNAPAANEFPKPAGANRAIFYERSGAARSFSEVMGLLRGKIERAMPDQAMPNAGMLPVAIVAQGAPTAPIRPTAIPAWAPLADPAPLAPVRMASVPKLSDMLRSNFAVGSSLPSSNAGDHARRAYERLKAFGL